MTTTGELKLREICTYHSDDGTSGYNLSEEQFRAVMDWNQAAIKEVLDDIEEAGRFAITPGEMLSPSEQATNYIEQGRRMAVKIQELRQKHMLGP